MRTERKWMGALAVALVALGSSQGTATAQIIGPARVERVWMEGPGLLHAPQLTNYAVEQPGCMLSGRDRVCGDPDLLDETTESRRLAVRQSRRDHVAMYRANVITQDAITEMQADRGLDASHHVIYLETDRMHTLRVDVQTALRGDTNTLRIGCDGVDISLCVPEPQVDTEHHGENLVEAFRAISRRLATELDGAACDIGCASTHDVQFCRQHNLAGLITPDWTHAFTPEGGAAVCQPSLEDNACQRRPVQALSVYTCESLINWWGNAGARADELRIRHESAEAEIHTRIASADQAYALAVAEAHATPTPTPPPTAPEPPADRDNDGVADDTDQCPDERFVAEHQDPQRPGCTAPVVVAEAAHHGGDSGATASARRTWTPPVFDHTLAGADMGCTAPVRASHHTWMSICEVRPSNASSLSLVRRLASVDGIHTTGDGTEENIDRINLPRERRAIVATLLDDNASRYECNGPILLGCRTTAWTPQHPDYFRQRLGVCAQVNGSSAPVTLETFLATAESHCGANPHVSFQTVTGGYVRLRFDHEPTWTDTGAGTTDPVATPTVTYAPRRAPTNRVAANVSRTSVHQGTLDGHTQRIVASRTTDLAKTGTDLNVGSVHGQLLVASATLTAMIQSPSLFTTALRTNAHYAEVMAHEGTPTRDGNVSKVGPPRDIAWWWDWRWHGPPPCALA